MKLNEVLGRHYDARMQTEAQLAGNVLSAQTSRYVADSNAASNKYSADAGVRQAQIREQSASADRLANRQTADENKRFGQYQAAAEQERRALSRIATEENGDQYKADVRLLESGASSTNPTMVKMRDEAQKRVDARKNEWNTIRDNAKRDTELAYSRLEIQGGTPPPRGGATAASSGAIPTTMTRAQVESVAKERNKTVAEVEAAAKAKGITIK
jgi:hypothetical protein